MCLGQVANRLFGNRSSKPEPQTPDPVGKESAVSSAPVEDGKQNNVQKIAKATLAASGRTASKPPGYRQPEDTTSSITGTGINY